MTLLFVNIILNILECINYYIIFNQLTQNKKPIQKSHVLYLLICGLLMGVLASAVPNENYAGFYKVTVYIFIFLSIHIFYNRRRNEQDSLILLVLMIIWLLLVQFLVVFLVKQINLINITTQIGHVICQFIITAVVFITYKMRIYKLYYLSKKSMAAEWTFYILCVLFLGYIFFESFNVEKIIGHTWEVFFFFVFVIICYSDKMHRHDEEINWYRNNYAILDEVLEQTMKRVHKLDNVVSSINGSLATSLDLEEHKKTIQKYFQEIVIDNEMKKMMTADNKLLIAFISAKKQQALAGQRELNCTIHYTQKCQFIEDYIIAIDLLGELIDNALQASRIGSAIIVELNINESMVYLKVENEHDWINEKMKKEIFRSGFSTKSYLHQRRGFGLANVRDTVKFYNGSIEVINGYDRNNNQTVAFEIYI